MKKQRKQRLRRLAERVLERKQRKMQELLTGVIHIASGGYGFFTPAADPGTDPEEVFIPAKFTADALDGDTVQVQTLPPRPSHPEDYERGKVGKVLEVIQRKRTAFVGELLAGSVVRPLNSRLPDDIRIHGSRNGAVRGDWVKVKFEFDRSGILSGKISSVIGKAGIISADLDAVMQEFDLPEPYSEKDDLAANEIIPRTIAREDQRELFTLTIDPADAKDFDDALSIGHDADGNAVIGVHIADVAAYIVPKSKFDEAAKLRAFSCYLPGRTLPMLPPGLTAKISMQSGSDALAHSVFLTVNPDGRVIHTRRTHTLVRIAQRLDYDEVQDFLDRQITGTSWQKRTAATLTELSVVARAMRKYREEHERFIDLPIPEVRVICDEKRNLITGIERKIQRESEQLVEEYMLAANQAVGKELPQRMVSGIYRVHPFPEPEKTQEFSDLMHDSFQLPAGDISDREYCRSFIKSLPDDGRRSVILNLLLRSLPRAGYSTRGDVHFALGKTFYAHFTSPIRRYADLTVHQQLWNADSKIRTRSGSTLEKIAAWVSEQEENIDAASFAAADRMKLRLLAKELENAPERLYDGTVVKVTAAGLQVDVEEFGIYGFVERDRLVMRRRSSYAPDPRQSEWKPGNYICLRLTGIDFARGCARFIPAR